MPRRVIMVGMLSWKNGRFFDLLSGDPSWPKFLTGTSHLYSKSISANRMTFSDAELDIGKSSFETFLHFGRFCNLLWLLDIVRGKVPFEKITILFCRISMPVILLVMLDFSSDIGKLFTQDSCCFRWGLTALWGTWRFFKIHVSGKQLNLFIIGLCGMQFHYLDWTTSLKFVLRLPLQIFRKLKIDINPGINSSIQPVYHRMNCILDLD